jgi:DNA polymerase III epsilon subunit-like protein
MTQQRFLALRDRAYAFVARAGHVTEEALLAHVYGGLPPPALRAQLAAPLSGDPRIQRRADGRWGLVGKPAPDPVSLAFTSLALLATGPNPERGRLVHVTALHVQGGNTVERFSATVHPGKRVPRYVAQRLGLDTALLDDLPPFGTIVDDLVRFLDARPIVAQDARLTWSFLESEARRGGQVLAEPLLVDANEFAMRVLNFKGKPSLALVAAQLGIGTLRIPRPEEEARILGLVVTRLLSLAAEQGITPFEAVHASTPGALQRGETARALPDEPGVYVLRDTEHTALYVGKARRLRSRLTAYVHRPLGATRRLEGLVGAVDAVDPLVCGTDLEALVLEDREIRRLQPRYNTARQKRAPRVWIRLPPPPERVQLAARRLELSLGPLAADGAFVGPFRNETLADKARLLARSAFDLDAMRRGDRSRYEEQLALAWAFLNGDSDRAEEHARSKSTQLLHSVLEFDVTAVLLPADPRCARYAVLRPAASGIEGLLIDRGIFLNSSVLADDDVTQFAAALLANAEPRTTPDDVDVVLRWFGAQRPPARLVHLPDDKQAATDAIQDAALALWEA